MNFTEIVAKLAAANFTEILANFTALVTILGVIFAVKIYFCWKRDFRQQKSHEYALELLKLFKRLHFYIESLRLPKFYYKNMVIEDIEKNFIPKIEEKIINPSLDIFCELSIAEHTLLNSNNLLKIFDTTINKKIIISKINYAVTNFYRDYKKPNFNVNECELWKIIYPAEQDYSDNGILEGKVYKNPHFCVNQEIINDEFTQLIETSFSDIYKILESNLINQ